MGSIISRSSSSSGRSERKKSKWRIGKRKEVQKTETSIEDDQFLSQNNHEQENSNGNLTNTYEKWDNRIDHQELTNFNGMIKYDLWQRKKFVYKLLF